MALFALGCTDHPAAPLATAAGELPALAKLECIADRAARTVACASDAGSSGVLASRGVDPDGATVDPDLIVGGQHLFINLTSGAVSWDTNTGVFTFPVTVQNLIGQALGTTDSSTVDPAGVRVFFVSDPHPTGSSTGTITVTADGVGTFTGTGQSYYQYSEIIRPNATSAPRTWTFNVPGTVSTFAFAVYVSAPVQHPNGWVALSSSGALLLRAGQTSTFSGVVKDNIGRTVTGQTVTWSSATPATATIDASSGVLTAVGEGTAVVTGTSGARSGATTVTVVQPNASNSSITASPSAVAGTAVPVTVRVNTNGNTAFPFGGDAVVLSANNGASIGAATDNGDGTYSSTVTKTGVGVVVVSGTLNGAAIGTTASVSFTAGSATQIDSVTNTILVQTAGASTGLSTRPQIKVSDANGNPVSGVTPAWSLGTCHSGVTFNGAATASDASGIATSPQIAFAANTGLSCAIVATVSGVTNSPMTFAVYVTPTASSRIWLGTTSTAWATPANWYGATVPTSTDDVFIPIVTTSARLPVLSASQSIASITTEAGVSAAISLGSNTLTASGSVTAFSPIVATTGSMQLSSAGASTVQGTLPATTIGTTNCASGGAYTLAGNLSTAGQLTVNCMVSVGANTLDTYTTNGADLLVQGTGGILDMTNASGVVNARHATFSGANSNGHLTAGTLNVYGNFRQRSTASAASFSPTSAHLTRLIGTAVNDSIYFQSTDTTAANLNTTSHFHNLRISTGATHKSVFAGYYAGDPHGLNTHLHVAGNLTIDQGDTLHLESANAEIRLKVRGTTTLNGVLRTTVDSGNVVDIFVDGTVTSSVDSTGHFQLDGPANTVRMDVGGSFTLFSNTGGNFTGLASLTVRGSVFEYDASGGVFGGVVSMISSGAQTFRVPAATLFNAVRDSTTGTLTVRNGFVTETLIIGVNSRLKMFDVVTTIQLGKTLNGAGGAIYFLTGSYLDLNGGSLGNLGFRTQSSRICQYKTDGSGNPQLAPGGDALRWIASLPSICFGNSSLAAAPVRTLMPLLRVSMSASRSALWEYQNSRPAVNVRTELGR